MWNLLIATYQSNLSADHKPDMKGDKIKSSGSTSDFGKENVEHIQVLKDVDKSLKSKY